MQKILSKSESQLHHRSKLMGDVSTGICKHSYMTKTHLLVLICLFEFGVIYYQQGQQQMPHYHVAKAKEELTREPPAQLPHQYQQPKQYKEVVALSLPKDKRYAYAFYATTQGHACGALVNAAALKDTGTSDKIDMVILTYGFNNDQIKKQAAQINNMTVKEVQHLKQQKTGGASYYGDVMVKLRVFQLFEYDRVIYMDADMMVRKNLDHLFLLPETAHFAAPHVYFHPAGSVFCSCFMVFKPTRHMWDRIMGYYRKDGYVTEDKMYDMNLLIKEFGIEATLLPGIYEMLTSHLISAPEYEKKLLQYPFMSQKLGMPNRTWEEIYNATSIVHFTGDKPTIERNMATMKRKRPTADPRFFAIFERYYSLAAKVCPSRERYSASNEYTNYF